MLDGGYLRTLFLHRRLHGMLERRSRSRASSACPDQLHVGDPLFDLDKPNVAAVPLDVGAHRIQGGVDAFEKRVARGHGA